MEGIKERGCVVNVTDQERGLCCSVVQGQGGLCQGKRRLQQLRGEVIRVL